MNVWSEIWKFEVGTPGKTPTRLLVSLPKGAEVVHVAMQRGTVMIWARCPESNATNAEPWPPREFITAATGATIPAGAIYYGTVDLNGDGHLIFHVFELPR